MSFSKSQQKRWFRPLVAQAWAAVCARGEYDAKDKEARDSWYREQLKASTGKDSTLKCTPSRDFEAAMAHFEAIAGSGILWQMKQFKGDHKRIAYAVKQLCAEYEVDEQYCRAIAKQALKREDLPELLDLTGEHLLTVLRALKIHVKRLQLKDEPF